MTQRPKLELQINKPAELEVLFDEPVVGESQYGSYNLYAVNVNDNEYSFFAPDEVHDKLKELSKGDKAIVTKLAAQRGNKVVTAYDVKLSSVKPKEVKEENNNPPQPHTDNLFNIMLDSYRDAIRIQEELGSLVDVSRIAITLFIARSKTNSNAMNGIR